MDKQPCTSCGKRNLLTKAINIVEGYTNLLIPDADIELMALCRLRDCYQCEHRKLLLTLGSKEIFACGKCDSIIKCPIEAKARVEREICPVNKW